MVVVSVKNNVHFKVEYLIIKEMRQDMRAWFISEIIVKIFFKNDFFTKCEMIKKSEIVENIWKITLLLQNRFYVWKISFVRKLSF